MVEFTASERHACELMEIARTTHRYCSRRDDTQLCEQLLRWAREKPRFGYRRIHVMLRRDGVIVNHKRVQRVYRELGLSVKRTRRKRLSRVLRPPLVLDQPNQEWAIDFVADVAASGQRLRVLSIVDSFTRECLALEVDTCLPSRRVTRTLEGIIQRRGLPIAIRCDNGPEITSRHFLAWCVERRIDVVLIPPGPNRHSVI
jgi:putative transposase